MSETFPMRVWVKSGAVQPLDKAPAGVVGWQAWLQERHAAPIRLYWLLAHPASGYYFNEEDG